MTNFFEVHHKLIGEEQQQLISNSNIAIIGLGGLGCSVAMGLVRLGLKNLTLIDADTIKVSNIPRQLLFNHEDVGLSKVKTSKKVLQKIFDDLNIRCIEEFINSQNGINHLKSSDIVIDCTDNYVARYAISKCCHSLKKTMIYGGVEGFSGQVGVFSYYGSLPFHIVFPNIEKLIIEETCNSSGVLPFVVQTVGTLQVIEAYKIICSLDNVLNNQLLCLNTLTGKQRILNLNIKI